MNKYSENVKSCKTLTSPHPPTHSPRTCTRKPHSNSPTPLPPLTTPLFPTCTTYYQLCNPGGGGTRDIYWWGVPWHTKNGGGVLGAGTAPQKGGYYVRAGTTRKMGVLVASTTQKWGIYNWSCSKGGLGSLFIYYLYFYLSTWSTGGGVFWQAEKGGSNSKGGGGVLGAGQVKKGGLYSGTYLHWTYMSVPLPPPPPPGYVLPKR